MAPFLGVHGLSFFIVLINLLIFVLIRNRNKSYKGYILGTVVAILIISEFFVLFPKKEIIGENSVRVVAIQSRNPVLFSYDDSYFYNSAENSKKAINDALFNYPDTDVIVLSENSRLVETIYEKGSSTRDEIITSLLGEGKERLLIEGLFDPSRNVSLSVFDSQYSKRVATEKDLLMPLGEYQPHLLNYLAKAIGKGEWFRSVSAQKSTNRASDPTKTVSTHVGDVSAVACSEILSFPVYKKIKEENPDFIVHQQRLAHFQGNTYLFKELLAVSQLRAAIAGKYVVGSVDSSGYSYIIDPYGKILELGNEDSKYVTGVISI